MADVAAAERLRAHVASLAGDIGERNMWRPAALRQARDLIVETWRSQGYQPTTLSYQVAGTSCDNIEAARLGRSRPDEIVLVGAHYDSVIGSPGADDNASGVAVLLELSGALGTADLDRTVRLVAFVNEEPPFFFTREMGSAVYARAARARGDDVRAMIALESIGYYRDAVGTQRYPPPLGLCYPDRGNFLALVSNLRSRRLLGRAAAAFRASARVPVRHLALPAFVPGVAWSDHLSFWRQGYRALMATDTALYRFPGYHTPEDTPDKLDYSTLAEVTRGLRGVVTALATEG